MAVTAAVAVTVENAHYLKRMFHDNIFSTVVMLEPDNGSAPLRAEGGKDALSWLQEGESVYAHLPTEHLMFLRGWEDGATEPLA